ncbi:hypothetical protein IC619_015990 [Hazenella sp. IB182353]|uniref:hypothetical protein n=1 Tax=Polycladospora coralii TaxID=2771432 RepID=UPI001747A03F|nr:hypothetical protein [Polycladospora coralii]MBS7531953.1 hypothetical protein [Polycladospora coralii]
MLNMNAEYVVKDCPSKRYGAQKRLVFNQTSMRSKRRGRTRVEVRLKAERNMDDTAFKEYLLHLRFFQMLTFQQLGQQFTCSPSSAQAVYKRYGIETKKRYNQIVTPERLYELYVNQGKTCLACADILDCSHTLVRYYLLKYHIPLRPAGARRIEEQIKTQNGLTDKQLCLYLTELSDRYTLDELVQELDHSKGSIRRMYKRLGLKRSWR